MTEGVSSNSDSRIRDLSPNHERADDPPGEGGRDSRRRRVGQPEVPWSIHALKRVTQRLVQPRQIRIDLCRKGQPRCCAHRTRLSFDRIGRCLAGPLQDVLDRARLNMLRQGRDATLECLQSVVELDTCTRQGQAAGLHRSRQRLDSVEKRSDIAECLDDECFSCRARSIHAGCRSSASASKQASSSGTTPDANRRVARRCARASFSATPSALTIKAL